VKGSSQVAHGNRAVCQPDRPRHEHLKRTTKKKQWDFKNMLYTSKNCFERVQKNSTIHLCRFNILGTNETDRIQTCSSMNQKHYSIISLKLHLQNNSKNYSAIINTNSKVKVILIWIAGQKVLACLETEKRWIRI
jgi:hypothetical protein